MNIRKKEKRNFSVLEQIVKNHIATALPVSSKTVAQSMENRFSSATIRNVMAELEDLGLIEQPHTSAGRVPTDTGYRTYVDHITERLRSEKLRAERLAREYRQRINSIEDIIKITSGIISNELHNASIVMWPRLEDLYLRRIELVRVQAQAVLAVLVTATNIVKNYILTLDEGIENTDLQKISNFINENFEDSVISRIPSELKGVIRGKSDLPEEIITISKAALGVIDEIMEQDLENELLWEGLDHFMDAPEFSNTDLTKRFLQIFSEKKDLIGLLRNELPSREIKIYIGKENEYDKFHGCSIITSGYGFSDRTVGRFGVIAPTRMNYDNALKTLTCLSGLINSKLEEIFEGI